MTTVAASQKYVGRHILLTKCTKDTLDEYYGLRNIDQLSSRRHIMTSIERERLRLSWLDVQKFHVQNAYKWLKTTKKKKMMEKYAARENQPHQCATNWVLSSAKRTIDAYHCPRATQES